MRRINATVMIVAAAAAAFALGNWHSARADQNLAPQAPFLGREVVVQIDTGHRTEGFLDAHGRLTAINADWVVVETHDPGIGTMWIPRNRVSALLAKPG